MSAKCPKCTAPGVFQRKLRSKARKSDVWLCTNKKCDRFNLFWQIDEVKP